jgi:hypothetical protein
MHKAFANKAFDLLSASNRSSIKVPMNKINLVAIFLALFLCAKTAYAGLSISSWEESSNLTLDGKNTEVLMKGQVYGLAPNQGLGSIGISFGKKQNIKISQVMSDDQNVSYSFDGNILEVKFPRGKQNNQSLAVYFSYKSQYKVNQYLREEVIDVPSFAAGANAKVTFNFPGYFESATFNPNITKSGNSFIYNSVVPQTGVFEIIKLTPAESTWDVTVNFKVKGNKSLEKIIVELPTFFQSPRQKVENYALSSDVNPLERKTGDDNNQVLTFDTKLQQMTVQEKAKVSTGLHYRQPISLDPNNYTKVSREESALLPEVLARIKQNPQYSNNLPLYVKIGKFVHEFIKYDVSYVGRLPEVKEILQNPIGVCTEYARLYDALARIAGIPSIIVDGAACGEYTNCRGHSWNMIFYNGKWIEVDPTWDLMSGVVSSSHVYLSNDIKNQGMVKYFDKNEIVDLEMDVSIKNLF